MTADRDPGWYATVRKHWGETTGFLVAGSDPCVEIRDEELEMIGDNRVLVGLSFDELPGWEPSGSWMLGVLLCPDDTTQGLATWAAEASIDPERVHFYLHPETSWEALGPWHDAGFPTRQVDDDIATWERLHRFFGLALSERIVKDASGQAV